MRNVFRCGLYAVTISFGLAQVAACSPKAAFEQHKRPISADSAKPEDAPQAGAPTKGASDFVGDWAYRTDCDRGHYVTLNLSTDGPGLKGAWSDGTQLSGSQGNVKGRVEDGKLVAEWCSDDAEAGGYPICPTYAKSDDYFVLRDQSLHWYRNYGAKFVTYIVMKKGADGQRPDTACAGNRLR